MMGDIEVKTFEACPEDIRLWIKDTAGDFLEFNEIETQSLIRTLLSDEKLADIRKRLFDYDANGYFNFKGDK